MTRRIDIHDNFDIDDIADKLYSGNPVHITDDDEYKQDCIPGGVDEVMKHIVDDLRRILVIVRHRRSLYAVYKENCKPQPYEVHACELTQLARLFQSVKLRNIRKPNRTTYNLYEFVQLSGVIKALRMDGFCFYSPDPRIYSIFAGYPYRAAKEINWKVLQPFLDHIRIIICDDIQEVNEYFWKHYAFIIKNPAGMTGKVPILIGKQGCGKTSFCTDPLCNLIGCDYTIMNCTDASNLFGHFNSGIEYKKMVVLNELASSESKNNRVDYERFKSTVSDKTIDINPKNEQQRFNVQNVFNLYICTNHATPLTIDINDRRAFILYCRDTYAEDPEDDVPAKRHKMEYFNNLAKCIDDPSFYPSLMAYVESIDITGWNPNQMPITVAKKNYIELCKRPVNILFEQNVHKFVPDAKGCGWSYDEIYAKYCDICKQLGESKPLLRSKVIGDLKNEYKLDTVRDTSGLKRSTLAFSADGMKKYGARASESAEVNDDIDTHFKELNQDIPDVEI